jgi:Protein of unknown function (DUF3179)
MASIQKATVIVLALAVSSTAFAQKKEPKMLPYTTIDHPQFVPASQASFLSASDIVIGVSSHGVTKAYPAADLAQHGCVQDLMPDGPIAVTW